MRVNVLRDSVDSVHNRDFLHDFRALKQWEWLEKQLGDKEEVIDLLRSRLDAGEVTQRDARRST